MNIIDLISLPVAPFDVPISGGVSISMAPIPAAWSALAERVTARPQPPLKQPPFKGSLAKPEPDHNDAEYLARYEEWATMVAAAEVALAMHRVRAQEPPTIEAVREAAQKAVNTWPRAVLSVLHTRLRESGVRRAGDGETFGADGVASGGSGSGGGGPYMGLIEAVGSDDVDGSKLDTLPPMYAYSSACLLMRACERFGLDPFVALGQWTPGQRAMAAAFERLRIDEERADRKTGK